MPYIKAKNPEDSKAILDYIVKDVKSPLTFHTVRTPTQFAKRYGKTHTIISYDFATKRTTALNLADFPANVGQNVLNQSITLNRFKKEVEKLKRPFVKPANPQFYMGFEIEGCIYPDYRQDLVNFLVELYGPGDHVDYDGSIRPKCRGIEIVTPPLPMNEAIEKLEWLFGMLTVLSEEKKFETNRTCGFHVNLSEAKCFKSHSANARSKFAYEFMKRIDPVKWRAVFRRENNKYCFWNGHPNSPADIPSYAKHWCAINTTHLNKNRIGERRLEVRVAGGASYHAKNEITAEFLLDIQNAMEQAYDAI